MPSIEVTFAAWLGMFASGLAGLGLARILPQAHTSDRSRDILGGVTGLMVLLLALVLGLLIWTAYGVTQTQKGEIQLLATRALEFDLEMKQYGPEAAKAREMLRTEIVWAHEQFWGESEAMADAHKVSYGSMAAMDTFLSALKPANDTQRHLLAAASAHYAAIGETRLQMSLQLSDPVSWPLILTVVAWSCLLFAGYGILSRANPTTLVALALGCASVSSAVFLILELSSPYTSLLKLSPNLLEQVIVDLAQ